MRSGAGSRVPTTFLTAYRYVEMGYTTVVEAASAPLVTRHTHEELMDMPLLDKAILITMGNNEILMDMISQDKFDEAKDVMAWLLNSTGRLRRQGRKPRRSGKLEVGRKRPKLGRRGQVFRLNLKKAA